MPDSCRIRGLLRRIDVDVVEVTALGERVSYVAGTTKATIDFGAMGELAVDLDRLPEGVKPGDPFIATITPNQ